MTDVLHGSVLGPLLFDILNDLPMSKKVMNIITFTDGTMLFTPSTDINILSGTINDALQW